MSDFHTQYLYSTASQKEATVGVHTGKKFHPKGKAGETYHEDALERIRQQDTTSTSEPLELLDSKQVPVWLTDKMVRDTICSFESPIAGIKYQLSRDDKDREWIDFFGLSNAADMKRIWNEAINYIIHGARAANDFPPYNYQQELIDSIVARFNAGANDQLLAAVMRSGKCFISYEVVRAMQFKKVLVLTGKTGVNEGWGELLPFGSDPHVYYANWEYHNYNNIKRTGFAPSGKDVDVLFTSLQYFARHLDAHNTAHVLLPKLVEDILAQHWDLVIFDEQHWGTQTDNTKKLLEQLKWSNKLELSGTAYKTLIQGRYDSENVHSFDYVDEQTRRVNGTALEQAALTFRPDINFALINIDPKIKNILNEDGFSFAKLMAVKRGENTFKNSQHVLDFLNFVKIKVYNNQYDSELSKFKPYVNNINRHTLWIVPNSVAGADALKDMLESHPYYKGFYIVPAYAGHIKNIDEVKDIIDKVDAGKYDDKPKGTITITMGRFLEGTTVPKWWCVHQMNDDKSAADYFQGSFRTKSEDKNNDKRHVLVYDYNPERFIQVVYEINLDNNRRTAGQTTGALIREWREVSDVYDYSDNAWNVVTGDSIVEQANRSVEVKINAFNSVAVDHQKITVALQQIMDSVNLKKQWNATTNLNTQGINTTSNQQISSNGTGQASGIPLVPNQTSIAVDKFKQAMGKIYNAIWNTIDREPIGSFDDICNYPDESFIETTTGLTPVEWTMWKNSGAIMNIDQINRRIDAINESLAE
jgi:hypothetical protein